MHSAARNRRWRAALRADADRNYTVVAVLRRLALLMDDLADRARLMSCADVHAAEARRLDMEADRR